MAKNRNRRKSVVRNTNQIERPSDGKGNDYEPAKIVDDLADALSKSHELTKAQRAGHFEILGETYAKFEFFEQGWNPYSRFLDVDKVDLILRRSTVDGPVYREIQVKYGTLFNVGTKWEKKRFDVTSWRFFPRHEFDHLVDRPDFFLAYVLAPKALPSHEIGYQGDIFIFPIRDFVNLLKQAIPSRDKRKVYISRMNGQKNKWVLRKSNNFAEINNESTIDVSHYRRNFQVLE